MVEYHEYELSDEIKGLGFSRIYRRDKNLVIYNSPALVHSRYFAGALESTLHHLEKALREHDNDPASALNEGGFSGSETE